MTLRQKQTLFLSLLAKIIQFVESHPNWALTMGEGFVGRTRTVSTVAGDRTLATDLVHHPNSNHYRGLAQDLNLFVDGQWITKGDHPAWVEIGVKWESLNPLCRWGGRFAEVDSNHFSLEHEGMA